MTSFSFQCLAADGRARVGRLTTAHGIVDTPAFMPVGTAGDPSEGNVAGSCCGNRCPNDFGATLTT